MLVMEAFSSYLGPGFHRKELSKYIRVKAGVPYLKEDARKIASSLDNIIHLKPT